MNKDGQTASAMENQIPVPENDHESRDVSSGKCRPLSKFIHDDNEKDDLSIISFDSPVGQERKVQGPHFLPKPLKKLKSLSPGRKKENSAEKNNESAPVRINYPLFKAENGSEVANISPKKDPVESFLNNLTNETGDLNLKARENAEPDLITEIPEGKTDNNTDIREPASSSDSTSVSDANGTSVISDASQASQTSEVSDTSDASEVIGTGEVVTSTADETFFRPASAPITESVLKEKNVPADYENETVSVKEDLPESITASSAETVISEEADSCVPVVSNEESDIVTIPRFGNSGHVDNISQVEIKAVAGHEVTDKEVTDKNIFDNVIASDNDVLLDKIASSKNSDLKIESIETPEEESVQESVSQDDVSSLNNALISSEALSESKETSEAERLLTKDDLEIKEILENEKSAADDTEKNLLDREETLIDEENTEAVKTVKEPFLETMHQMVSIQPEFAEKESSSEELIITERTVESRFGEVSLSKENSYNKIDQQLSSAEFADQLSENFSEGNVPKLTRAPELKSETDNGNFSEELTEESTLGSILIERKNNQEKTVSSEKFEETEVTEESANISSGNIGSDNIFADNISIVEKTSVNNKKNIVIVENVSDESSAVAEKGFTDETITDEKFTDGSDLEDIDQKSADIDLNSAAHNESFIRRGAEQDSGETVDNPTELVSLVANQGDDEISVIETQISQKISGAQETFDSETNAAYLEEQQAVIPFSLLNNKGEDRKRFDELSHFDEWESSDQEKDGQFIIFNRFLLLSRRMARKKEQASCSIRPITEECSLPCSRKYKGSSSEIETSETSGNEIFHNVNEKESLNNQENMESFSRKTGIQEDLQKKGIQEECFERAVGKNSNVEKKEKEDHTQENRFIRLLMRLTGRQKNHLADFLESMEDKTT